jgi:hypothetical protein
MEDADGFKNNQFEGTWTNYRMTITKKCNWGDFRIPNSEKLDSGTGEFIPTETYLKYGWQSYRDMASGNSEDKKTIDAIKLEDTKWWIDKN